MTLQLCRLMVENHIFEAVGCKRRRAGNNKKSFDDSASKFYCFCEEDETDSLEASSKDSVQTFNESSSYEEVTEARPINRLVVWLVNVSRTWCVIFFLQVLVCMMYTSWHVKCRQGSHITRIFGNTQEVDNYLQEPENTLELKKIHGNREKSLKTDRCQIYI